MWEHFENNVEPSSDGLDDKSNTTRGRPAGQIPGGRSLYSNQPCYKFLHGENEALRLAVLAWRAGSRIHGCALTSNGGNGNTATGFSRRPHRQHV